MISWTMAITYNLLAEHEMERVYRAGSNQLNYDLSSPNRDSRATEMGDIRRCERVARGNMVRSINNRTVIRGEDK